MAGEIKSIDRSRLRIHDATGSLPGPVDLTVELTPNTLIRRTVGSAPSIRVLAGNDVPLHVGDNIEVGGPLNTDGSLVAEEIEVQAFSTRDGIVTSIGPNYFDVRLREDRMSEEFSETSTRIWVPTTIELQNLRISCGPGVRLSYLKVGEDGSFQGLIADDGSYVAVCLFGR